MFKYLLLLKFYIGHMGDCCTVKFQLYVFLTVRLCPETVSLGTLIFSRLRRDFSSVCPIGLLWLLHSLAAHLLARYLKWLAGYMALWWEESVLMKMSGCVSGYHYERSFHWPFLCIEITFIRFKRINTLVPWCIPDLPSCPVLWAPWPLIVVANKFAEWIMKH